jgi:hypothetical protein
MTHIALLLSPVGIFDSKHIFLFEGKLYEYMGKDFKCGWRVILHQDDYDYVTDRNLRRRLNRAHKVFRK